MKKLILFLFVSTTLIACNNEIDTSEKTAVATNDQASFDGNINTFNGMVEAFKAEDAEKVGQYFADSLQWVGPGKDELYDSVSKAAFVDELVKYFSVYHDHDISDVKFYSATLLSGEKGVAGESLLIVFGNRKHMHVESNKPVNTKWMAKLHFDQDGKINYFNEFYDITGFFMQHLE